MRSLYTRPLPPAPPALDPRSSDKLLLKTDYPLRSRDDKIGENGTVGLCVYLDLEQTKRKQKREQVAAARRQQAIDLAIVEVGCDEKVCSILPGCCLFLPLHV